MALRFNQLKIQIEGEAICCIDSLEVAEGAKLVVTGKNGSGKTSLLRSVAGLHREYSGDLESDTTIKQRVFVHQTPSMFSGTVRQNVAFGLRARKLSRREVAQRCDRMMEQLGIESLSSRNAKRLSGGEKKKVAIARAWILTPKILLLDEPFAELDAAGSEQVKRLIEQDTSTTILISSPVSIPGFDEFLLGNED